MTVASAWHPSATIVAVVALVFASNIGQVVPVSAQVSWQNGQPLFGAERDTGPRQFERRRYTAIADGGGRPQITP